MRYMVPHISSRAVGGYTAPAATVGPAARESIVRFSRAIPGLPRSFYPFLKEPPDWYLLMEGTIGPDASEGILQQVRLVEMDPEARSCLAEGRMLKHALVACSTSRKDTFLSELARNVWSTLPDKAKEWQRDRFKRMAWIDAGHNPLVRFPLRLREFSTPFGLTVTVLAALASGGMSCGGCGAARATGRTALNRDWRSLDIIQADRTRMICSSVSGQVDEHAYRLHQGAWSRGQSGESVCFRRARLWARCLL